MPLDEDQKDTFFSTKRPKDMMSCITSPSKYASRFKSWKKPYCGECMADDVQLYNPVGAYIFCLDCLKATAI